MDLIITKEICGTPWNAWWGDLQKNAAHVLDVLYDLGLDISEASPALI